MKFPVSVWSEYYLDLQPEQAIDLLTDAGFTHMEWGHNHMAMMVERGGTPESQGRNLAAYAKEKNVIISQGHLSFIGGLCDDAAVERVRKDLDYFLGAGIQNAVLHANGGKELTPEERFDRWVESIGKLQDHIKGTKLILCLENLASVPQINTAEGLLNLINACGGENLGICLDTGHLHISRCRDGVEKTHAEFIHLAGDRLKALHINENNGMNDVHQMPYSARTGIDWKPLVQALKDVRYGGLFNLEILGERNAPLPIRRAKLDYIRKMCDYMLSDEF